MEIFNKTRLLFQQLKNDSYDYLVQTYQRTRNVLTPASPFTQIIDVLQGLFSMTLFYVEDAVNEQNIFEAQRPKSIYGWSRLTGHDPMRGKAASGEINIRLNQSADVETSFLLISNYSQLISTNNNLTYSIILDQPTLRIDTSASDEYNLKIYQGTWETEKLTGEGEPLQSFNLSGKRGTFIDDDLVKVYVNGEKFVNFESLYDMTRDEKGCLVKTGISGGIDVFFGNGNQGYIPPLGSTIIIEYLQHIGIGGNIESTQTETLFEWSTDGLDLNGEEVDLNEVLTTKISQKIIFGSNPEPTEFSKLVSLGASRTKVLANETNYIYFFKRLQLFSIVDAFTTFDDEYLDDDNIIYIFLVPDINLKFTNDSSYFTIEESKFLLQDTEKTRLLKTLNESGSQVITSDVSLIDPVIRRYGINIVLRVFEGYNEAELRSAILRRLHNYFLSVKRRDKIPSSDIISIIEEVNYVDSVNVKFISQRNEEAITNGFYYKEDQLGNTDIEQKINIVEGENPNLGLDEFGDIEIKNFELPLIRGNWFDRNGQFYEEKPDRNKVSSVNILVRDVIPNDLFNQLLTENRKGNSDE